MNTSFLDKNVTIAQSERIKHPLTLLFDYLQEREGYRRFVLFAWIFSVYIEFPFALADGKAIPSVLLVLLLPFIWPFIKDTLQVRHLIFFTIITGLAVISVIPHLSQVSIPGLVIRLLQYAYSVFMAVMSLLLIVSLPEKDVRWVLVFFLWFMVIGVVLERVGLLSPITIAFKSLYEGTAYGGEIAEWREEDLVGFVRPLFFTTEPSLVGLGFIFLSSSVVLLSKSLWFDLILPVLQIIMLICLASPTILLSMIVWGILMAIKYKMRFSTLLVSLILLSILGFVISTLPVISDISEIVLSRFSNELLEEGTSLYARLYVPYTKTIPTVLEHYPLLGAGYSNHSILSSIFGYPGGLDEMESQFILGANGTANFINYLGLVGFFGSAGALIWLGKKMNVKHVGLLIMFWIALGQTIGTFSPPRYWCYTLLFLGLLVFFGKRENEIILEELPENISPS